MKVLLILAAFAAVTSAYRYNYRPSRDIGLNLRGQIQTSYSSDNDLYVPPVRSNSIPQGYDYPKPPPPPQPIRKTPSRVYLPDDAPPPPSSIRYTPPVPQPPPLDTNFLPLPTEERPTYVGNGPYIWDYVSEGDHKVDVQDPFHKYQVRFLRH